MALNRIKSTLLENIKNQNTVFVFSTDVVMNSWIDWLVMNPELSGTTTVPLERFTAWDHFKSEYISSSQPGKCTIPSLLKKMFVRDLICQNAASPFLKKIINPEFTQNSTSFTDWISGILPSLELWHRKYSDFLKNNPEQAAEVENDVENQDYLELYNRYSTFLDKNNMFEPNWIFPDFTAQNLNFIVFYPEIYDDYADYAEILKSNKSIQVINLSAEEVSKTQPECYKFDDSRQELRRIILQMRKLVSEKKCSWNEISFSVPNLETYRPYLERELSRYCVPYIIRAGLPLTQNSAGQIFCEIDDCVKSDFSYDSLRALLLDEYIPWKDQELSANTDEPEKSETQKSHIKSSMSVIKENLIREGNRMRCICSLTDQNGEKIDIWEEALKNVPEDELELTFYSKLKHYITKIYNSESFAEIKNNWLIFKEKFLDESNFSLEANQILGRCITHLNEMAEIEEQYSEVNNLHLDNHYNFFLTELKSKSYTRQNHKLGVNVYPYKLTAQANFKYQFVIDASQKNLEIPYKRLSFLSTEKRALFGLLEDDTKFNASKAFTTLYSINSAPDFVQFSYAEDTFDGFAIPHTSLKIVKNEKLETLDSEDFFLNEKKLFLERKLQNSSDKFYITQAQKNQFEHWEKISQENKSTYSIGNNLKDRINYHLIDYRKKGWKESAGKQNIYNETLEEKYILSQSDMKSFFPCQRRWLFKEILKLSEDSLSTDLMGKFDFGNINHKILELFLKHYKNKKQPLPTTNADGIFDNENEISSLLDKFIDTAIATASEGCKDSPLVKFMLNSQKAKILSDTKNFLYTFCSQWDKKIGFGGFSVLHIEDWFSGLSQNNEIRFSGKLDCVLSSPNEDIFIVDFKTGDTPTISSCIAKPDNEKNAVILNDFQIPMYLTIYNTGKEDKETAKNAMFYSIKEAKCTSVVSSTDPKIGNFSKKMEEYKSSMETFETYANMVNDKIKNQELEPISDTSSPYNYVSTLDDCKKCPFNRICRRTYSIGQRALEETRM